MTKSEFYVRSVYHSTQKKNLFEKNGVKWSVLLWAEKYRNISPKSFFTNKWGLKEANLTNLR